MTAFLIPTTIEDLLPPTGADQIIASEDGVVWEPVDEDVLLPDLSPYMPKAGGTFTGAVSMAAGIPLQSASGALILRSPQSSAIGDVIVTERAGGAPAIASTWANASGLLVDGTMVAANSGTGWRTDASGDWSPNFATLRIRIGSDAYLYRSAAATWKIDSDGSGGAANLAVTGTGTFGGVTFPEDVWIDAGGNHRFYFASNSNGGDNIYRSANGGHIWRNASDTQVAYLSTTGALSAASLTANGIVKSTGAANSLQIDSRDASGFFQFYSPTQTEFGFYSSHTNSIPFTVSSAGVIAAASATLGGIVVLQPSGQSAFMYSQGTDSTYLGNLNASAVGYVYVYNANKVSFMIGPNGNMIVNGANHLDASVIPLAVRGSTSQVANLQEWQTVNGDVQALIDANGRMSITPESNQASMLVDTGFFVRPRAAALTTPAIVARGGTIDGSSLVQRWENAFGTTVASVDTLGALSAASLTTTIIDGPGAQLLSLRIGGVDQMTLDSASGVTVTGAFSTNALTTASLIVNGTVGFMNPTPGQYLSFNSEIAMQVVNGLGDAFRVGFDGAFLHKPPTAAPTLANGQAGEWMDETTHEINFDWRESDGTLRRKTLLSDV